VIGRPVIHFSLDYRSMLLYSGGLALVVAGLVLLGYARVAARKNLAQRVDALLATLGRKDGFTSRWARRTPAIFRTAGRVSAGRGTATFARLMHLPPEFAADAILAFRIGLGLLGSAVLWVLASRAGTTLSPKLVILLMVCGGGIGWFGPTLLTNRLAARRLRQIEKDLPEAIELLIIGVEAGLALEDALDRVVSEMRRNRAAIAEEFALTLADMRILPNRETALANLAQRVALSSVRSVVTMLSQTMHYGTPLAQALHVAAAELRNDAMLRLEENVNKLTVTLTLPLVLFILPSILLIVGGPAVLKVIAEFAH
jgi:tight adherence protein C